MLRKGVDRRPDALRAIGELQHALVKVVLRNPPWRREPRLAIVEQRSKEVVPICIASGLERLERFAGRNFGGKAATRRKTGAKQPNLVSGERTESRACNLLSSPPQVVDQRCWEVIVVDDGLRNERQPALHTVIPASASRHYMTHEEQHRKDCAEFDA